MSPKISYVKAGKSCSLAVGLAGTIFSHSYAVVGVGVWVSSGFGGGTLGREGFCGR